MTRSSYGNGDPAIPRAAQAAHDAAIQRNEAGYIDPETGLFVMTTLRLFLNGGCCGTGCRHCPYPASAQRRAGRPVVRPE